MKRVTRVLLSAVTLLCSAHAIEAQSPADERARVIAVADSALAAVTRKDFVAFTDLMLDSAVTFSVRDANGQVQTSFRTRAAQRATQIGGALNERGFSPEVHISGPLAVVWMPYDFYADGKWSHCGVDTFTLLKAGGRWRIASLIWSVEQPPACQRHPDGPPRE